jgi:hypothetical protein
VGDLTMVERGDNLDINFTIAPLTTEGLPLKKIGEVELRVGPNQSNGFNMAEWVKSATRVDVPTPANPGPVSAIVPVSKFAGSEVIVAVRVTNPKGKDAGWSPPKIFDVKAPLADPTNFRVAADPKGVALTWGAAGPSQFRVLRKLLPEKTRSKSPFCLPLPPSLTISTSARSLERPINIPSKLCARISRVT